IWRRARRPAMAWPGSGRRRCAHFVCRSAGADDHARNTSGVVSAVCPGTSACWRHGADVEYADVAAYAGTCDDAGDASLMGGIVRGSLPLLLVALSLAGALAVAAGVWLIRGGISAKEQPGALETAVARRLRSAAIPARARSIGNPVQAGPEVIRA